MTYLHSTDDTRNRQGPDVPRLPSPRLTGRAPRAPASARPSHDRHLSRIPRYSPRYPRLDLAAVVVPTNRPGIGSGLGLAARLAEAKGSHLVVLRSGDAAGEPFPEALVPHSVRRTVVLDLPPGSESILPSWESDEHTVATLHRDSDLGFKRNLALLLGRMCGWDALLFLSDDVRSSPASDLARRRSRAWVDPLSRVDDVLADFATYPQLHAAGWFQRDFDDNSVIGHARRMVGQPQETFISGGALAVRCGGPLPLFPAAYNDDWLFFLHLMLGGWHTCPSSAVKYVGTIHQDAYYPFTAPRARSEELGDLFAEGLFTLLGAPREELLVAASSRSFWDEAIDERRRLITELLSSLYRQGPLSGVMADAEAALRAAFGLYTGQVEDPAESLATFWMSLQSDMASWSRLLRSVTPVSESDALSPEDAVDALGLGVNAQWHDRPESVWGSAHNQVFA